MPTTYTAEEIQKAHEVLYAEGLAMRTAVLGQPFVDRALAAADTPFTRTMQEYGTEAAWGSIWTRGVLDRKTRSFLNIAMLCGLNRGTELGTHVRGALNNGASEEEIREVLLQVACYCGMPAGMEGFRVAARVIKEVGEERGKEGGKGEE